MAASIDWNFNGRNNDGTVFTSKQIEALIALDEFDFLPGCIEFNDRYYEFATGITESYGSRERIREAVEQFAKLYPETRLVVTYKYDFEWYPEGFIAEGGEVVDITGHVTFTRDDNGEEVIV